MKLSKILFGAVAGAAVLGLVSCGPISGAGKKYTIDYTNDYVDPSSEDYNEEKNPNVTDRWYKDTALKHAGGLVKVTFKSDCVVDSDHNEFSTYGAGMMGTIFGYEDSVDSNAPATAHDFYILSVSQNGYYYVSRYVNITEANLKEANFGATETETIDTTSGKPQEKVYKSLGTTNHVTMNDTDGEKSIYLYERALVDGSYEWAILNLEDDEADSFKVEDYETTGALKIALTTKVPAWGNIPATDTGITPVDSESKLTQKKLAVYANIYVGNTLHGEWYYQNTYKEAEVIE